MKSAAQHDTDLWLIKTASGGSKIKISTRYVPSLAHPPPLSIDPDPPTVAADAAVQDPRSSFESTSSHSPPPRSYSKNATTTRTWPVINRSYHQYDYEALYQLNNSNNNNNNNNGPYHHLQQYSSGSECGGGIGGGGSSVSGGAYEKDSSDQTLYVPARYVRRNSGMNPPTEISGAVTTCTTAPPVIFLLVTLLVTTGATAMLCCAIMSDHWEHVDWDRTVVDRMTKNSSSINVQWYLNDKVAGVTSKRKC